MPEDEPPPKPPRFAVFSHGARQARTRLKANRLTGPAYRITVGVVGALVIALGLLLVPFPGPGWLIVIIGLVILASEFAWARHLLEFVKAKVRAWTDWITDQTWPVRLAVGLATAAFVGAVLYVTAYVIGLPGWVPGWVVPPLPGLEQYSTW